MVPARHFTDTIIIQRNVKPSTHEVSHRTCVSKRMVVGGGGDDER